MTTPAGSARAKAAAAPQNAGGYDRAAMADCMEAVAQRRDRAAFATLYDYFAPRLKGYLMRMGASDVQAEELVQEVMVTVWRKAHLFDRRRATVATWLYTVARNRRVDALRREKFPDYDPEDPLLLPTAETGPFEAMEAEERASRVRAAMAALPEAQAELVRLAFFRGWTHVEIAERQGVPLGTVKSRLRLAFRKLRAGLEDMALE